MPGSFRGSTRVRMALPRRIVTLTPALAEQVFALGLGRRVVGVTIRSNHPRAAARKPCVGTLHKPDLKLIASLRPDLVLAARELNRPETIRALRARGLCVYVVPAYTTCAQVLDSFRALGRMLGRAARASALAARVEKALRRRKAARRPRVFLQVWDDPLMGPARGSYLHDLIERCGGKNVLGSRGGRVVRCAERGIVRANPDVILITLRNAAPQIRRWRRYPQLSAVERRRIHAIPACWVTPSPVMLACGARELRRLLRM